MATTETSRLNQQLETAACEAARLGGDVLMRSFRSAQLQVEQKGLHDFVTEVDRESEAAVTGYLHGLFPDHAILAEETPSAVEPFEHRWVVDPLDGTTNYIHGVGTFAVSVAVEDRDGVAAAAVYDPVQREMFHARRGGGAYCNDARIRCAAPRGLDPALIATGFPFREMSRLKSYLKAFEIFVQSTAGLRRAGAAALDLAYVAAGRYDGFWEIGLSRWDIAAGVLLVTEAGGQVTDPVGANRFMESGDLVAAGPEIHAAMIRITRECFG